MLYNNKYASQVAIDALADGDVTKEEFVRTVLSTIDAKNSINRKPACFKNGAKLKKAQLV